MPYKDPVKEKEYHHQYHKDYYQRTRIETLARVKKSKETMKLKAIDYLGGKCTQCGYIKCPGALEFHHRDPNEKCYGISKKGLSCAWEILKVELDKCDLLCSNCHREFHWEESNGEVPESGNGPVC